ncbi:hypothetical protein OV079_15750 [Nannocystis pusilla]|uniref:Uncharacterized protein n=1 Tax=Nannocystis pusilla TaxID=889268 RepID=A0A9X3IXH4_9BACT|nr:hypothetical protein [Nannocystis pusilla]
MRSAIACCSVADLASATCCVTASAWRTMSSRRCSAASDSVCWTAACCAWTSSSAIASSPIVTSSTSTSYTRIPFSSKRRPGRLPSSPATPRITSRRIATESA